MSIIPHPACKTTQKRTSSKKSVRFCMIQFYFAARSVYTDVLTQLSAPITEVIS